MPIKSLLKQLDGSIYIEGVVLVTATPFLLFPTVSMAGTLLSFCLLAAVWLLPLLVRSWRLPPATPVDLILLLFALMVIVGILVTADPDLTLPKVAVIVLGMGMWRFINRVTTSRELFYLGTGVYIILAAGFVFLGILNAHWLFKIPVLSQIVALLPSSLIDIPDAGTGVHANQIAGTLLFLLPLFAGVVIGWLAGRRSYKGLLGWIGLFGLSALLVLLTQSRTGWLAVAGTLFLLSFCWGILLPRTHRLWRWIWAGIGLMSAAGLAVLAWVGPQRLLDIWQNPSQETIVGNVGSIGFRQEVWRWGITAVTDFPFTGTGLGTYRRVVRRLYPLNFRPDYDISHAHNLLLQTALDIGLPGLVTYLALIMVVVLLLWQAAKRDEGLRPFAMGFLGVIIALHLFGIADALALGSKTTLMFWILLGLITALHRLTFYQPLAKE